MDTIELLRTRRSCRKFTDALPEREKLEALLETTLHAPSSKNCRSTRFIVVEDSDKLEEMSTMRSTGSSFLKEAPVGIVIMGDKDQTDLWRENCSISATYLQIAAEAMGFGTCWIHVNGRLRDNNDPDSGTAEKFMRTILDVPKTYGIMCVIALGYPAHEATAHAAHDDSDKVEWVE